MIEQAGQTGGSSLDPPVPGYVRKVMGGVELVAHHDVVNALSTVIERFGTLYEWAQAVTLPLALRGRAPVYVAHVPGSPGTDVVVRHGWHGGILAPLTRDLFVRPTRAPSELRIGQALRAHHIGTPELLAYALYDAGPGVVRFDVASRYIPDSYDLAVVLSGLSPVIKRATAFEAIVPLLRLLALHGFTHPDLNVKNILLSEVNRSVLASVLDVDVMQHDSQQSPERAMQINVNRLKRSMVKSRRQFGVRITDQEIEELGKRLMAAAK